MKRGSPRVATGKRKPAGARAQAESRVRAARITRGLSQGELAEATGLTRQAVYSIESQHYLPNVTTALRLARTLGRRVEDLFGQESDAPLVEGALEAGVGVEAIAGCSASASSPRRPSGT